MIDRLKILLKSVIIFVKSNSFINFILKESNVDVFNHFVSQTRLILDKNYSHLAYRSWVVSISLGLSKSDRLCKT